MAMNDKLFAELMASIEEAGQIAAGRLQQPVLHRRSRAAGCEAHPRRLQSVTDPVCRAAGHQRQDPAQLGAEPALTCRPRTCCFRSPPVTPMPCGMSSATPQPPAHDLIVASPSRRFSAFHVGCFMRSG